MAWMLSFLLLVQNAAARPQQPGLPELIKRLQPSVVTVLTYDSEGKRLGQGTGFFIGADGRFVTNVHVLEDAYRVEIKTRDGRTYEVKSVLADDATADVIIAGLACPNDVSEVSCYTISAPPPQNGLLQFRPLTLNRAQPEIGQSVVVIGSPLGLEQTVSTGIISAIRTLDGTGKVFQISAPISPGSSGSPVINLRGEVVGVATSQYAKGQSLNFAVPADRLPKRDDAFLKFLYWADNRRFVAAHDYLLKGNELRSSGCEEAVPYYREAVRRIPNFDHYHFTSLWWDQLAYCLRELRRYDEAIDTYRQAIHVEPGFIGAYNRLGDLLSEAGRDNQAIEAFKEAIRLGGENPFVFESAYMGLGRSYLKLNRYQEAIQAYRKATENDQHEPQDGLNELGSLYLDLKMYQEALSMFREEVRLSPNSASAHLNLGITYANLNRPQDALAEYRAAVRIAPDWDFAHYNLGSLYLWMGNRTAAVSEYELLKQVEPKVGQYQMLTDALFHEIYK